MPVTMPAAGRLVVVEIPGGQRRELEERGPGIEQLVDPLPHRQLALLAMPLQVLLAAALPHRRGPLAQLGDEGGHALAIPPELLARRIDVGFEAIHRAEL